MVALVGVAHANVEIFPVDQVHEGLEGQWVSAVDSLGPQKFPLKLVGVSKNFAGPGRDIIWVRAADEVNIGTGPVAGMSGSPVYVDGKWLGAYAYGFAWPKNEALIGVTPAADMLALLDDNTREGLPGVAQAKPMAVGVGGFSPRTIDAFRPRLEAKGICLMDGVGLGDASEKSLEPIKPGSAVVGLLMDGDFKAGAVGTVSWVSDDGQTLLAFGHPFLGRGSVTMPMASAQVVTVVSAYESSFKLANIGEPIGAITFDRQPGVVGKLGQSAPMATVRFSFAKEGSDATVFSGRVWDDVKVAPELVAMSFLESLNTLDQLNDRQSYAGSIELDVTAAGQPYHFQWPFVFAHDNNAEVIADNLRIVMESILDNPFQKVLLDHVGVDATLSEGWQRTRLMEVELLSQRIEAGKNLDVALTFLDYRDKAQRRIVSIPIPANVDANLQLEAIDSKQVAAEALARASKSFTWDDFSETFAELGRADQIVLRLTQAGGALERRGQRLDNLPTSLVSSMEADNSARTVLMEMPVDLGRYVELGVEKIIKPIALEEK